MSIRMVLERIDGVDLHCPKVFCDHCGDRIDNDAAGYVMWDRAGTIYHVHRRPRCGYALEKARGDDMLWVPLSEHVYHLITNLDIDIAETRKRAAIFAEAFS